MLERRCRVVSLSLMMTLLQSMSDEWEKRRNPDKAQFDAKEPDRRKFEEEEQARKHQAAVSHHTW